VVMTFDNVDSKIGHTMILSRECGETARYSHWGALVRDFLDLKIRGSAN